MSIWWEVDGVVKTRNDDAVNGIIDKFNERSGDNCCIEVEEEGDTLKLVIEGAVQCSYQTAEELEGIIAELSPYVTESVFINTQSDGEEGSVYVGLPGDEDTTESKEALEKIKALYQKLTVSDKCNLLNWINNPVEQGYEDDEEDEEFVIIEEQPNEEMLALEQRIIAEVTERGWDAGGEDDVSRTWSITKDGTIYSLYVESWRKRYCAKYNIIEEGDNDHVDLEWSENEGEKVMQWFDAHPDVRK